MFTKITSDTSLREDIDSGRDVALQFHIQFVSKEYQKYLRCSPIYYLKMYTFFYLLHYLLVILFY